MDKHEFLKKMNKGVRKPIPGIEGAYMVPLLWTDQLRIQSDKDKLKDNVLWTLAYTIQDEEGNRIFGDDDLPLLKETLQGKAGTQLNILSFEVNDVDIEALSKNSKAIRTRRSK